MKTPNKLENYVVTPLLERLQDEYDAMYFYENAANWCQNVGYTNAAKFFKNESTDEREHARGIEEYLTNWNVLYPLPNIVVPNKSFKNLIDVIEQAYDIEYALYEDYEEVAKVMLQKDICTFNFLGKYLKIQVDSVAEYSDMLNELKTIGGDSQFAIFYWQNERFED